jgi:DNA polymerase-1
MDNKRKLLLIDSNSLIHRAFHALPPLANKKGDQLGAVYGFLLVFFKGLKDINPQYVAAAFDVKGPTFRHKEFDLYKAQRPKMSSDLSQQIPKVKRVLRSFKVPIFEKQGFEADDIIGTISQRMSSEENIETIIMSGDKDLFQLVDSKTKVYGLRKGVKDTVLYNIEEVILKYEGLKPKQLIDFKGLRGDPSDNIAGVPGVGKKTGIKLIKTFGSLERLYEELEDEEKIEGVSKRIREKLLNNKKEAFLSKKLVKIKCDVPIDFTLKDCLFGDYKIEEIKGIFNEFEFNSLVEKIPRINISENY